jgi:transposase
MDESGIDSSLCRNYARAKRGIQIKTDISGKKTNRTSVIAGWFHSVKKFIAPYVFDGYTDNIRFNEWLEKCFLPEVEAGSTIVMDNASFHKGSKTKELIEKAGCKLLYLPPYSPDYNPIENQWAVLKAHYKTFKSRGYEHNNAIDAAFSI